MAKGHILRVIVIIDRLAVYIKCVASRFDCIPFNGYDAFDEIPFPIMGWNKNENISAGRFMEIKNLDVRAGDLNAVDKLTYQNPIADKKRIFH